MGSNKILINIGISDFQKLIPIVYKTKSRVRIKNRHGLPFLLQKILKHKILISVSIPILIIIFILSMFVWDVQVTGNEKINTQRIISELATSGVRIGTFRKNVSPDYVRHEILLKIPEISWIGIDIIGTRAFINVREREKEPEFIDYHTPRDIYSPKSGVIVSIDVANGTKLAKIGDTVEAGQMLVKGEKRISDTELVPSHAMAKIVLKTWYETDKEIVNEVSETISYHQYQNKYKINVFGLNIPIYLNRNSKFSEFSISESDKAISIGHFALPIRIHTMQFQKIETKNTKLMPGEAIEHSKKQICNVLDSQIPEKAEIVNKFFEEQIISNQETEKKHLKGIYECLEEI